MKPAIKFCLTAIALPSFLLMFALTGCTKIDAVQTPLNSTVPPANITVDPGQTITLAGSGSYGFEDGSGQASMFNNPNGVAVDVAGNLYVTDQGNNMIRKITPDGVVSTVAGNQQAGFNNGTGSAASFNNPIGIAVDGSNNIFVADFGNNVIRKISPAGEVTTWAGSGTIGFNDGMGTAASFNGPTGIALDKSGNLYVSDNHNIIRKITPGQQVSTFAGNVHNGPGFADGMGALANFRLPEGLATDAAGNIYVADNANNMIRKITPDGNVTTLAGQLSAGHTNGQGTSAAFSSPYFVAVDASGNVYVTDNTNNVIRKISAGGMVTTFAGSGAIGASDGANLLATFNDLHGIAVDALGNVYVGDEQNNKVRKIGPGKE